MIRPPGFRGAAFGHAADGDPRRDAAVRSTWSSELGVPDTWAWSRQVHGRDALWVDTPGLAGDADALSTDAVGLPLVVVTADCVPVIIESAASVSVVHVGWRGAAAGVLEATLDGLDAVGERPRRGAIGPAIGPCCYEVGDEVAARFPGSVATTERGTQSVDLPGVVRLALEKACVTVWDAAECTHCGAGYHSYRRDRTELRQAAVGWLPTS